MKKQAALLLVMPLFSSSSSALAVDFFYPAPSSWILMRMERTDGQTDRQTVVNDSRGRLQQRPADEDHLSA